MVPSPPTPTPSGAGWEVSLISQEREGVQLRGTQSCRWSHIVAGASTHFGGCVVCVGGGV